MATLVANSYPLAVEFMSSSVYEAKRPAAEDPFRHQSGANSHNHHSEHPWGPDINPGSATFDALYAQANNQYMYHLWYSPALNPYMATELIHIEPLSETFVAKLASLAKTTLDAGFEAALTSDLGVEVETLIQAILDSAGIKPDDQIFVRLGATSAKDSFALNVPTTKPTPLPPKGNIILRRLLTSGRTVGRVLALSEKIWPEDPGEAFIIQRWSADIELQREFRVFCYDGRVTAISQDIWWEKLGWRERYSEGFADAIVHVWESVKAHVPFKTCTMDVLMTETNDPQEKWQAKIIEFNGFGAHLNTGSDLFHWINDADTLQGRKPGITLRFVDDWEKVKSVDRASIDDGSSTLVEEEALEDPEPDWLALEKKLKGQYGKEEPVTGRLSAEEKLKLPLRGRWCSAY